MVAGAKYRGEFEERLKVLKAVSDSAGRLSCLLMNWHTVVGAGAAEGAMDAGNSETDAGQRRAALRGATTPERISEIY